MQGVMLILATVTVTAFLTDLVYAKLDPRVKLE